MISVTNAKVVRFLVDDQPFDVRYSEVRAHVRVLDFRADLLQRYVEWVSQAAAVCGCARSAWCRWSSARWRP